MFFTHCFTVHLLDSTGGIYKTRSQLMDHTFEMKHKFVSVTHNACYMCNVKPKYENYICRLYSGIATKVVRLNNEIFNHFR